MKNLCFLFILFSWSVAARAGDMQETVDQATTVLERFATLPENNIPAEVMKQAQGLAVMTVVKAGFIFSGRGGEGVVVARVPGGWSGPSAIVTGGVGFGLQIGAQVSEFVIVLNTPAAVRAFSQGGNVKLGADLSAAAGPVGRNLEASVTPTAAVYTYSRSQGLFAGVSLEGAVLAAQPKTNQEYYGRPVTPRAILRGQVPAPAGAKGLLAQLLLLDRRR